MNLYENLMAACAANDMFSFKDYELRGRKYRLFEYDQRIGVSSFNMPDAHWIRGTIFDITNDPVIVSRPMPKFFNYGEANQKKNGVVLDYSTKLDGTLIRSVLDTDGSIWYATKGELRQSQFTEMVEEYFQKNPDMKDYVESFVQKNKTVCMELTSPKNRVVVEYPQTILTILMIVDNDSGDITVPEDIHRYSLFY